MKMEEKTQWGEGPDRGVQQVIKKWGGGPKAENSRRRMKLGRLGEASEARRGPETRCQPRADVVGGGGGSESPKGIGEDKGGHRRKPFLGRWKGSKGKGKGSKEGKWVSE